MMPDSLEPEVSTEVQDPASAGVTSWDDVSPQLTETREMEIPRPTEPLDEERPAQPVAPPTKPLSGLTAQSISAWFGDHKVLDRVDIYDAAQRPTDVRRRIGMVFQKPNPFPAMSIYDNVASGLKLAGIKVADKDDIVESSLRRAGLWNEVHRRLKAPGGGLSGGQQQRLCIARALAVTPDVLLMDEPCSALDPTSTRRIEDTIAELHDQVTIVIVTHNMQQAARVSQKTAFFLATDRTPGYIVETGPTEQIFEAPNDPRTADYVNGRFG